MGFSQRLLTPFHRNLAEAIWLHLPDKPESDTMDTRWHASGSRENREFWH